MRFMEDLPYTKMRPQTPTTIESGLPERVHSYVLQLAGKLYAMYFYKGESDPFKGISVDDAVLRMRLKLRIPSGRYSVKWIDPKTGRAGDQSMLTVTEGAAAVTSPVYSADITLLMERI